MQSIIVSSLIMNQRVSQLIYNREVYFIPNTDRKKYISFNITGGIDTDMLNL